MTAQIIRFPVERRLQQVEAEVTTAGGETSYTGYPRQPSGWSNPGLNVTSYVTISNVTGVDGVEVVTPDAPTMSPPEGWWSRVGPDTKWAKVGFFPLPTAKRHRVLDVVSATVGNRLCLVVLTACGRRSPLSGRFDEKVSGGLCRRCRATGL